MYLKWYYLLLLSVFFCAGFTPLNADDVDCIRYSQFGAVGDGVTDDFDAIARAHEAANNASLPVKADDGATYYIGGADKTIPIGTDTDWGDARFIIDDRKVENRGKYVFDIVSMLPSIKITDVKTLEKDQKKIDLSLPYACLLEATDRETKRYIREGLNRNNGASQSDVFVVNKNGRVERDTPILWNFDNISSLVAYPIDNKTLTVKGGHFTTIANRDESKYTYYSRGIKISRSNVVVDGVRHEITGEGDHGSPYRGFILVSRCTEVLVQNSQFSGHKTYRTIGSANAPVSMGSYDISVDHAVNVTFRNCKQINDIHDTRKWGIFASNYSKNITFDNVEFSRFDAHMGVANATIKNSTLGHQGINLIGSGRFLIENSKVCSTNFINLRSDYGSTWEGEIVIRNCEYIPRNGAVAVLVSGSYSGQHNFGYTCYMPEKITIDGLVIDDADHKSGYKGPRIFATFNTAYTSDSYKEKYPYVIAKEVVVKNMVVKSGMPYSVSDNRYMFRNVVVRDRGKNR